VEWFQELFLGPRHPPVEDLRVRIRQKVHELMKHAKCELKDIYCVPRLPSTSANYVNTRGDGGCVETILRSEEYKSQRPLQLPDIYNFKTLLTHRDRLDTDGFLHVVWNGDEPVFDIQMNRYPIDQDFTQLFLKAVNKAYDERPLVEPVALSEALKVRMITKCPPWLMFVMNSFIEPLRKHLRTIPTFELTGTPQEETIMDRMFPDCTRKFCNGDYKAATDKLRSWVSECIADELLETFYADVVRYDPRWVTLFKRSLTGFICRRDGKNYHQTNGQLMGSVSSFPVLCLANYALCSMAQELSPSDWRGMLINGDDCVFECNEDSYEEGKR